MRTILRRLLILLCWLCIWRGAFADPTPTPQAALPASLEAPANQSLALELTAQGVQIYECRPVPGDPTRFEWAFKAPEADLFDAQGHKVGRHYAGPTWEVADGKVIGRVKAKADAPDGKGIPWLLLDAAQASGGGILGKVQSIQRVNTFGGKPPAEKPDQSKAGQVIRVDYTATYRFYVAKS